jgi:acyl-CoA dehydrogenase
MLFPVSPRVEDLKKRLTAFMEEHVYPAEDVFERELNALPSR